MKHHDLEGDSPLVSRLLLHRLKDCHKTAERIQLEESLPVMSVSKNKASFLQIPASPNQLFF